MEKKNLSNYIRLQPVFIKKRFKVNEKHIFSREKMRYSGSCTYDYVDSFIEENFQSNALYWFIYLLINYLFMDSPFYYMLQQLRFGTSKITPQGISSKVR